MESKKIALQTLNQWIRVQKQKNFVNLRKKEELLKELQSISKDLKENLTILICGEFNAGKSTFINALLGQKILVSDVTPATAIITKLTYGNEKKVIAHFNNNRTKEFHFSSLKELTAEGNQQIEEAKMKIKFVEIQLPEELLKYCTLVDSPGLTSLYQEHTNVTNQILEQVDVAVWLFNAMNVGTASEIEWLKKLDEFEIPVIGLVNGIDRIDEDENLEAFYEFNLRRLAPLVTQLDGISARDILEGKLTENRQLMEWGNIRAFERLLLKFEEQKIDRFFQDLKVPLKKLNDILQKEKNASLRLKKRNELLKSLRAINIEAIEVKKAIAEEEVKKEQAINEWELHLHTSALNPLNITSFLNKFKNSEVVMEEWKENVLPYLEIYLKRSKENNLEEKVLTRKQKVIEEHYDKIESVYFKFFQTYKYIKVKKEYNAFLETLKVNREFLEGDRQEVKRALEKYQMVLHSIIMKEINVYDEKIKILKEKWRNILAPVKMFYGNWDFEDLVNTEVNIEEIKTFQNEVLSQILFSGKNFEYLNSYKDINTLINELNKLYSEDASKKLVEEFLTIIPEGKKEHYNIDILTIEISNNWTTNSNFSLVNPSETGLTNNIQKLVPHLAKDPAVIAGGVAILMSIY